MSASNATVFESPQLMSESSNIECIRSSCRFSGIHDTCVQTESVHLMSFIG